MRLILVPPYRGAGYDFKPDEEPYYHHVLDMLRASGQLDGVTVDIDPGVHTDHVSASRDQSLFDHLAIAVQTRVRAIVDDDEGAYDAIVVLGGIDVGFDAVRTISPIPVAYPIHSSLHVASLVSDRFSYIDVSDPQAARVRRLARSYGLEDKLVSVRNYASSSTVASPVLRAAREQGRLTAEATALLDDVVTQCTTAIDVDGAETLIVGFTPLQVFQDDLRARLDEAGYAEIPVIWILDATIAVAKMLAEMRLKQTARAFPTDDLVAKPSRR
jgi:Asp/Glu/hydantoin racemase